VSPQQPKAAPDHLPHPRHLQFDRKLNLALLQTRFSCTQQIVIKFRNMIDTAETVEACRMIGAATCIKMTPTSDAEMAIAPRCYTGEGSAAQGCS
jgi:hypothetical protein